MNKNKKRFTSALLLAGTSVASAYVQNVNKCAADGDSLIWTYFLLPLKNLFSSIFSCFVSKEEDDSLEPIRVSGGEYFKAIFGVSEEEFRKGLKEGKLTEGKDFRKDKNGNIIMINSKNGREYCAGKIEFESLGDLRKIIKNIKGKEKGKISILGINKSRIQASEKLLDKIDVSCLQSSKENKDAVFLVASNWNIVEGLGYWDSVEEKYITGCNNGSYFDDGTQAPSARLTVLAGTAECHYFINMEKYPSDPSKWSQTSKGDRQVNLLEGLGIKTINGYIVDDIENIKKVVEKLEEKDADLENRFKICYHGNQQVCAKKVSVGSGPKFADVVYDPEQKIDQIYTAAVSLGYIDVKNVANFNKGQEITTEKFDETRNVLSRLAKQIARLNYEAIIKTAIAKGKKKLYLTLLGCGAFENKSEWVIEAINNCKELIETSGLEVIINISGSGLRDKDLYKKLAPLIYDSNDKKVGNFDIFDEQDGNVVNVGEDILNKVKSKIVDSKSKNADKGVLLSGNSAFE